MYERQYGSKAAEHRDTPVKDIAALIRADVKAAKSAGELPADLTVSVRYSRASMCQSIEVEVRDAPHLWEQCPGHRIPAGESVGPACPRHGCPDPGYQHDRLTDEGERIVAVLKGIHWAYNHDGSDTMTDYFDVRYYGQVGVESEWGRNSRLADKAARAARKNRSNR